MSRNDFSRLAVALLSGVILAGLGCKKLSDHFALGLDLRDVTGPQFQNFQPSSGTVLNGDNFMFDVVDPTTTDGAPTSGFDPSTLRVTVGTVTFPVTINGMITVDLSITGDGTHNFLIEGSDMAGNASSTTYQLDVDRTGPEASIDGSPPSDATTNMGFPLTIGYRVADPHFDMATIGLYTATNGVCGDGDDAPAENADPPSVTTTTTGPQTAMFAVTNPVEPDGDPVSFDYCVNLWAADAALGKDEQPNPNRTWVTWSMTPFRTTFTAPPPTGDIVGTVTLDDDPYPGVSIQIQGPSMRAPETTDANGDYIHPALTPGQYQVQPTGLPNDVFCDPSFRTVQVNAFQSVRADFPCQTVQMGSPSTEQLFGAYVSQLSRTMTQESCPSPISGNNNTMVTGDAQTNQVNVGNLDPVVATIQGTYDPDSGEYGGGGTGMVNDVTVGSSLTGTFSFHQGTILFDGYLERTHSQNNSTLCVEGYVANMEFAGTEGEY